MNNNPLKQLASFGQSIWLDYIRRGLVSSGELRRLIEADGLRGITSNPANTLPMETLDAYRDHGAPQAGPGQGIAEARLVLEKVFWINE